MGLDTSYKQHYIGLSLQKLHSEYGTIVVFTRTITVRKKKRLNWSVTLHIKIITAKDSNYDNVHETN